MLTNGTKGPRIGLGEGSTSWIMDHGSCVMYHASCIMYHASCIMYHASCIMCHASCIMYHVSCIMHHVSCERTRAFCQKCTGTWLYKHKHCVSAGGICQDRTYRSISGSSTMSGLRLPSVSSTTARDSAAHEPQNPQKPTTQKWPGR